MASDPMIRETGHMETSDGYTLSVGVDYDHVAIYVGAWCSADGVMLSSERAEEFAQLFVSAVWQAGQQKARMDGDVVDAEIWCTGNCVKGPGLHLSTETCQPRNPRVAQPGAASGCICGQTAAGCAETGRKAASHDH